MAKSETHFVRDLSIEIRQGDDSNSREFYAWQYKAGTVKVWGHLQIAYDEDCATAGDFKVDPGAPHGTAHALLYIACQFLYIHKVPGVVIHVDENNRVRKSYRRMGFEQTNIPGIMTANLDSIIDVVFRYPVCAHNKGKV